ncbi:uncharacterized protein LOC143460407 [Clavelina lepadiformis]|uniref:C-type lectin domain-containing protein n=1 Tax=Clavelina lepadiformis TaxID=159417 RepID=A0ABP0GD94_CLALP
MYLNALCSFLLLFCTVSFVSSQSWQRNGSVEYLVEREQVYTYAEATTSCSEHDAILAIVNNVGTQRFLELIIQPLPVGKDLFFYIGLRKQFRGKYEWVDGSKYSNSFTNWISGEPSNGECVILGFSPFAQSHFHWWSLDCSVRGGFVCQREARSEILQPNQLSRNQIIVISVVAFAAFIKAVITCRVVCDGCIRDYYDEGYDDSRENMEMMENPDIRRRRYDETKDVSKKAEEQPHEKYKDMDKAEEKPKENVT